MSDTADNLLKAASDLFAQRGYDGASVRAICQAAGTNVNAISFHFGGKQALYEAVLARLSQGQMQSAQRILGHPPNDMRDLETRLLLFAEETLAAHMAEPELLVICMAEFQQGFRNCDGSGLKDAMRGPSEVIVKFLDGAKRRKLLRKGADTAIVAGTLLERIHHQVQYADTIQSMFGLSIRSPKYRLHWVRQQVNILLHGAAQPQEETP